MNKDELIQLKERLVKERLAKETLIKENKSKRYVNFSIDFDEDITNVNMRMEELEDIDEIIDEINTQQAIDKLESLIVDLVKDLTSKGVNFQRIGLFMDPQVFVSEDCLIKFKTYGRNYNLTKEDVLYDVCPAIFCLSVFENGDKYSKIYINDVEFEHKFMDWHIFGVIKYNDFVEGINSLGYDISIQNFDEYIEGFRNNQYPQIVIDFSKQKEHKR